MGVWIETLTKKSLETVAKSHPSWVCGLKHKKTTPIKDTDNVTPFVGVWIETIRLVLVLIRPIVTPFVGVWIETM